MAVGDDLFPLIRKPRMSGAPGKSGCNMRGHFLALLKHPVFKIEVLADNLESLVKDFPGILISAGPDGQVNHALLFGFQVNRHGCPPVRAQSALTLISMPCAVNQMAQPRAVQCAKLSFSTPPELHTLACSAHAAARRMASAAPGACATCHRA